MMQVSIISILVRVKNGTGKTVNVYISNCLIQRAQKSGIVLDNVAQPMIQNCFIEENNRSGNHAFIRTSGRGLILSGCYFTPAKRSAPNSTAIEFEKTVRIVTIENCFFSPNLGGEFISQSKTLSLSPRTNQINVKKPLDGIHPNTEVVSEGNSYRYKVNKQFRRATSDIDKEEKSTIVGEGSPIGKIKPSFLGQEYLDVSVKFGTKQFLRI